MGELRLSRVVCFSRYIHVGACWFIFWVDLDGGNVPLFGLSRERSCQAGAARNNAGILVGNTTTPPSVLPRGCQRARRIRNER